MPKKERKVGLEKGKFYPCYEKHVCVSTLAPPEDKKHYISPLSYSITIEQAMERVGKIINSMKRTKLLEKRDNYLHFMFTTFLFRFKDDVEFLFENGTLHFRSQSRMGGYDWGTNRNRMEKFKQLFLQY